MTAIELLKFVEDNDIESRWETNDRTGERDVIIWVPHSLIPNLCKLDNGKLLQIGGITCNLRRWEIAIFASLLLWSEESNLIEIFGPDPGD